MTRARHLALFTNPNGVPQQSPGLLGTSYPGYTRSHASNPNGVALRTWSARVPQGCRILFPPKIPINADEFVREKGKSKHVCVCCSMLHFEELFRSEEHT